MDSVDSTPMVPVLTSSSIRWERRCLFRFLHSLEGRLVFVGNAGGNSLTVDLWPAMQSNQTLMGVFMGPLLQDMEFEQAWTRCCRL